MLAATAALEAALVSIAILPDVSVNELVFARAETAVGYAPIAPGGEQSAALVNQIEPGVGISFATTRSTLELTVSPRIYHRTPNFADMDRPLFLLRSNARYVRSLDPRLEWTTLANVDYGEVEYGSARLVLDSPLARPAEQGVLRTFDAGAGTGLAWTVSPTYVSSLDVSVTRTQPLDQEDERAYPLTRSAGGDATQRFRLDEVSTLSTFTSFRYYSVSANPDWISVPLGVGYRRDLERRTIFGAGLGATVALEVNEAVQAFPTGEVFVERVVYETTATRLTNRFGATLIATYDPFVARLYPVAGLDASLAASLGRDWVGTVGAFVYSAATAEPVIDGGQDTSLGVQALVGYRISDEWSCEFGARESSRATHFSVTPVEFTDGETWAFARIVFALRTGEGIGGRR